MVGSANPANVAGNDYIEIRSHGDWKGFYLLWMNTRVNKFNRDRDKERERETRFTESHDSTSWERQLS